VVPGLRFHKRKEREKRGRGKVQASPSSATPEIFFPKKFSVALFRVSSPGGPRHQPAQEEKGEKERGEKGEKKKGTRHADFLGNNISGVLTTFIRWELSRLNSGGKRKRGGKKEKEKA